ncbi:MAG: energy-coupling factor ABC transporter permease [Syntrophomonas sp.]|nr:energy-coupling factor ABC transporter permease [Syntrophomonas sp.]
MHMADALVSPLVGGTMLAVTAGLAVYSAQQVRKELDDQKIPLMGVMGAFVFAAQMINFTIPATGSSGHIGGGLLLAALLGPHAGFLTMAAVLLIQALFFADGGLLAYGCNVFNMGFWTCFVAYPLFYKWFTGRGFTPRSISWASLVSVVVALQLGAFSVVLQTLLSGKTELPFTTFVMLMQPIHLAIGIGEGLISAAVLVYVWNARPEILARTAAGESLGNISTRRVLTGMVVAVFLVGGVLSWFASTRPDGLEWSIEKVAGTAELEKPDGIHQLLGEFQDNSAILPDYGFKSDEPAESNHAGEGTTAWPTANAGTSVAGLVGGAMTLLLAGLTGWGLSRLKNRSSRVAA